MDYKGRRKWFRIQFPELIYFFYSKEAKLICSSNRILLCIGFFVIENDVELQPLLYVDLLLK